MRLNSVFLTVPLLLLSVFSFATEEKTKELEAPTEAPKDAPAEIGKWEGFRGIKWGTERKDIPGISKKKSFDDGLQEVFGREKDFLSVGDAKLLGVYWCFFEDKLSSVVLMSKEKDNYDELLKVLKAKYGDPLNPDSFDNIFVWAEDIAAKKGGYVRIEYDVIDETTTLVIGSAEIMHTIKEKVDAAASRAGKEDL